MRTPDKIMALTAAVPDGVDEKSYRLGHRDARHAAAGLVVEAEGDQEQLVELLRRLARGEVKPLAEVPALCPLLEPYSLLWYLNYCWL